MISMQEFNQQFVDRHEFEYDDSCFLSKEYPKILFKGIPQAWVCCIFDHLSLMNDLSKIISISQIFGFPVVQYENNISNDEFSILKDMENMILCIDVDLHKQLDAVILN
jgi:hypothetical protein